MLVKSNFAQLDSLRAIAALSVFARHLFQQFVNNGGTNIASAFFKRLGAWGVSVFFALSGFCIHWARIQEAERSARSFDRSEYFQRRFLRIYPALTACLLLCFFLEQYRPSNLLPWSSPEALLAHFFLLSNFFPDLRTDVNSVLWSVVLEVHFYLLYGLLWRHFTDLGAVKRTTVIAIGVSIITFLLSVTLFSAGPFRVLLQHTLFATFWAWCLGALVAEFVIARGLLPLAPSWPSLMWLIWLSSLAIGLLPDPYVLRFQRFVLPILAATGLYFLIFSASPLLSSRLLGSIGLISYSLYLFHPVAIWLVLGIAAPAAARILLALAIGLVLSVIGYKFLEAHFLRLRLTSAAPART